MPTFIGSQMQRGQSGLGPFALADGDDLRLHFTQAATINDRDNLPAWKRKPKMFVYVVETDTTYQLGTDTTPGSEVWTEQPKPSPEAVLASQLFDENGKIKSELLTNVVINDTFVVDNVAAMLALTTVAGNIVITTDTNTSYLKLNNDDPATIDDFADISGSTGDVSSVNGQTGPVSITHGTLYSTGPNASSNLAALNSAISGNSSVQGNAAAIVSLNNMFANYLTTAAFNSAIANYDTSTEVDAKVATRLKPISTFNNFYTNAAALLADQANHTEGHVYYVQTPTGSWGITLGGPIGAFVVYNGTTTGNADNDYTLMTTQEYRYTAFWGGIQGSISSQADLVALLAGKAAIGPNDGNPYVWLGSGWDELANHLSGSGGFPIATALADGAAPHLRGSVYNVSEVKSDTSFTIDVTNAIQEGRFIIKHRSTTKPSWTIANGFTVIEQSPGNYTPNIDNYITGVLYGTIVFISYINTDVLTGAEIIAAIDAELQQSSWKNPSGEVNTLSGTATPSSFNLVLAKTGSVLNIRNLIQGDNIVLEIVGNDLRISATGGGSGTARQGELYTSTKLTTLFFDKFPRIDDVNTYDADDSLTLNFTGAQLDASVILRWAYNGSSTNGPTVVSTLPVRFGISTLNASNPGELRYKYRGTHVFVEQVDVPNEQAGTSNVEVIYLNFENNFTPTPTNWNAITDGGNAVSYPNLIDQNGVVTSYGMIQTGAMGNSNGGPDLSPTWPAGATTGYHETQANNLNTFYRTLFGIPTSKYVKVEMLGARQGANGTGSTGIEPNADGLGGWMSQWKVLDDNGTSPIVYVNHNTHFTTPGTLSVIGNNLRPKTEANFPGEGNTIAINFAEPNDGLARISFMRITISDNPIA